MGPDWFTTNKTEIKSFKLQNFTLATSCHHWKRGKKSCAEAVEQLSRHFLSRVSLRVRSVACRRRVKTWSLYVIMMAPPRVTKLNYQKEAELQSFVVVKHFAGPHLFSEFPVHNLVPNWNDHVVLWNLGESYICSYFLVGILGGHCWLHSLP